MEPRSPRGFSSLAFKAGARYSLGASGGNRFGPGAPVSRFSAEGQSDGIAVDQGLQQTVDAFAIVAQYSEKLRVGLGTDREGPPQELFARRGEFKPVRPAI